MATRSLLLLTLGLLLTACATAGPLQGSVADAVSLEGDSNPRALAAAEKGELGKPTVVFFHAEWCNVCRQARPEVDALATEHADEIAVVRMNIDEGSSRAAVARYDIATTPTFLLLAADGNVLGTLSGWPGREAMELTIQEMLEATH